MAVVEFAWTRIIEPTVAEHSMVGPFAAVIANARLTRAAGFWQIGWMVSEACQVHLPAQTITLKSKNGWTSNGNPSGLSNLKVGAGSISRLGDSPGFRHLTVAIAKTADPNT